MTKRPLIWPDGYTRRSLLFLTFDILFIATSSLSVGIVIKQSMRTLSRFLEKDSLIPLRHGRVLHFRHSSFSSSTCASLSTLLLGSFVAVPS